MAAADVEPGHVRAAVILEADETRQPPLHLVAFVVLDGRFGGPDADVARVAGERGRSAVARPEQGQVLGRERDGRCGDERGDVRFRGRRVAVHWCPPPRISVRRSNILPRRTPAAQPMPKAVGCSGLLASVIPDTDLWVVQRTTNFSSDIYDLVHVFAVHSVAVDSEKLLRDEDLK